MRWRDLILSNLGWKLLSLVLATLAWVTINTFFLGETKSSPVPSPLRTREFPGLPITVLTAAADLRAFKATPNEVTVTLRGSAQVLQHLQPAEIEAFVNLLDIRNDPGVHRRIHVYTPPGVTVLKVTPEEVRVQRVDEEPNR